MTKSNPAKIPDAARARKTIELTAGPEFRFVLEQARALYDPTRADEPLDDGLRSLIVVMTTLESKARLGQAAAEV